MRYFKIYADEQNPQPRFLNWYSQIKPGRQDKQIYEDLAGRNYFKVELAGENQFMDILCHPCFMVSREFANVIRLYCPEIRFKYALLFDEVNKRTASRQIPDLPEIDCLDAKSELSRDRSEIITGILTEERIGMHPIFRLAGVKGRFVIASLEFVESVCRREVMGMKIREFIVE